MVQPAGIELQTGTGGMYAVMVRVMWLLAAATLLGHLRAMQWPLIALASALLLWLWPGTKYPLGQTQQLRLFRNGTAVLDGQTGTWGRHFWCCRWCALLRIEFPQRAVHGIVCASRNPKDEYRRLLVWHRFLPFAAPRPRMVRISRGR